jgi:hypothetical protein
MMDAQSTKQKILIVMVEGQTALALGCFANPTVKPQNIDCCPAQSVTF